MENVHSLLEFRQEKKRKEQQEVRKTLQFDDGDLFCHKRESNDLLYPNIQVFGVFSSIMAELDSLGQTNFVSFFFSIRQNIHKGSFLVAGTGFIDLFINGYKLGITDIQMLFIEISNLKSDGIKEALSQKLSFLHSRD